MTHLHIFLPALGMGGTESHLIHILPALKARGWHPEVFVLSDTLTLAPHLEAAGIPVRRISLWQLFLSHLKDRTTLRHYFLPKAYLLGALTSFITRQKAPEVMSRRSLNLYQKAYPGVRFLEKFLHKRMAALSGNSAAILKELEAEGAPPQKLKLIYNGITAEKFAPDAAARSRIRASLGLNDQTVLIITVANLIPYKGHLDTLRALALMGEGNFMWICVGRDAGIQTQLEREAARFNLRDKIRFLGAREDVPALLAAADISILASHEEGFPNALLESMAAELPVIATTAGGMPELVVAGETGLLVPPKTPPALGAALQDLLDNAQKRRDMGRLGAARVKALFSLDACVTSYEKMYQSLL